MENKKIKLVIGLLVYGKSTEKYLPYFLSSLKKQTYNNFKIIAADNSEEEINNNKKIIDKQYPEIELIWSGGNVGYGKAYNVLIRKAVESGAEYFLALNIDMLLENDALEKMIKALEEDNKLGSVCPKIKVWDFNNNNKTNILDSCGIIKVSALRFTDLGQGQEDAGQCDSVEIIGPSGAAAMYRISALEKIKYKSKALRAHKGLLEPEKSQYFDELMFMYEEDCDLAYRLQLAGYKSKCITDSVIYHDRTASAKGVSDIAVASNRKNKSKQVRRWGFLHKHIIFLKYWRLQSFKEKLEISWYAFKMFIYACIFEQFLLKEYFKLFRIKKYIKIYK